MTGSEVDPADAATPMPRSAQRVVDAAAPFGVALEIVEHPHGTRTAADAATAVGCSVGQIVKSMIFEVDGEIVLALTSGSNQVDTDALTRLVGGSRTRRADPDRVRAVTGFAIGGVPPFGHDHTIRAFVDPALFEYEVVWAAAGTPRHVFPIGPRRLAEIARAEPGEFAV